MADLTGMRIEQISLDEHLVYKGRMAECFNCGVEYEKKNPLSKYCEECKGPSKVRYSTEAREKPAFYGRDTFFDVTEVFIPEDLRSDRWTVGMYLISKALIFYSIVDAFRGISKLKDSYRQRAFEIDKRDAIRFLLGDVNPLDKEWVDNVLFYSRSNISKIRRLLSTLEERNAA